MAADPFGRGCLGERAVCRALSGLSYQGYVHEDDRRWPGRDRANVDHVLLGPSGVFLVDAKFWAGQIKAIGNSILQDGRHREERFRQLDSLAAAVDVVLEQLGYWWIKTVPIVCFADSRLTDQPALGRTLITDIDRIANVVTRRPSIIDPAHRNRIWDGLLAAMPAYDASGDERTADALFALDEADATGMRAELQGPVEDWMIWLHPEQRDLVKRQWNGPARIRGAAGTGKTTVGLHRLLWLTTTRPGPAMWVSYVKTLSPVMENLYRRLSPETADRVTFTHVHEFAREVLDARGVTERVGTYRQQRAAWTRAWRAAGAGLEIDTTGLPQKYFEAEVDHVIKGRDIRSLDDYLTVRRHGRRTAFNASRREQVWQLHEAHEEALHDIGCLDFVDPLVLANRELEREPWSPVSTVVVDEVQDLPAVGVQMLHRLVGDRPDAFLLLGDGQQQIYEGGWALSDLGISVTGRSHVLRNNYRNTMEILAVASSSLAGDTYEDLEGYEMTAERGTAVSRHGEAPAVVIADSEQDLLSRLTCDIAEAMSERSPGDIAVLLPTNSLAAKVTAVLVKAGIPCISLKSWDGAPRPSVRIGTHHRAKGLEFPLVFLPFWDQQRAPSSHGLRTEEARQEVAERDRRRLFVAMTRARDRLWLGSVRA